MRAWVALPLLGLLLVPGTHAIAIGPAQTLTDFPAQIAPPARGDGFTAWVDLRDGVPQILLHWDEGETVRVLERNGPAIQHLSAWGDWLAWSQQAQAAILPGEQAQRLNWDLVVYDISRHAIVYDSASAQSNETNPALADGRIAFLDDATGVRQVMVADLSGRGAFQAQALSPTGRRQGPPEVDGAATVYLQDGDAGDDVVFVRDGQAQVLASAGPGVGLGPPVAWAGRVAWPEHRGPDSRLVVWQAGATSSYNWTGGTVLQAAGDGPLFVAEVREEQKGLWAWCEGEQPQRLAPGIQSRPAVADAAVAYLVQVGAEQHVQQRTLSCGDEGGQGTQGSPPPGPVLLALVLLALAARRRR